MPTPDEVNQAKSAAQLALFKRIEDAAANTNTYEKIERLARAYRYVAGGAQPGGTEQAAK